MAVRILTIYDSAYGNTEVIARVIAQTAQADICFVKDVTLADLETADLIIVGSPTQGGKPSPAISEFLQKIPAGALRHAAVATFDTRFAPAGHSLVERALMKLLGFAAPKMMWTLRGKGAHCVGKPEGFIVQGMHGPLAPGEAQRAMSWTRMILCYVPGRTATRFALAPPTPGLRQ